MAMADFIKKIPADKIIFTAGILGMIFILISSLIPDDDNKKVSETENSSFGESDDVSETKELLVEGSEDETNDGCKDDEMLLWDASLFDEDGSEEVSLSEISLSGLLSSEEEEKLCSITMSSFLLSDCVSKFASPSITSGSLFALQAVTERSITAASAKARSRFIGVSSRKSIIKQNTIL